MNEYIQYVAKDYIQYMVDDFVHIQYEVNDFVTDASCECMHGVHVMLLGERLREHIL